MKKVSIACRKLLTLSSLVAICSLLFLPASIVGDEAAGKRLTRTRTVNEARSNASAYRRTQDKLKIKLHVPKTITTTRGRAHAVAFATDSSGERIKDLKLHLIWGSGGCVATTDRWGRASCPFSATVRGDKLRAKFDGNKKYDKAEAEAMLSRSPDFGGSLTVPGGPRIELYKARVLKGRQAYIRGKVIQNGQPLPGQQVVIVINGLKAQPQGGTAVVKVRVPKEIPFNAGCDRRSKLGSGCVSVCWAAEYKLIDRQSQNMLQLARAKNSCKPNEFAKYHVKIDNVRGMNMKKILWDKCANKAPLNLAKNQSWRHTVNTKICYEMIPSFQFSDVYMSPNKNGVFAMARLLNNRPFLLPFNLQVSCR